MFDALAYLIDKKAFGSAVEFVANQLQNSFEKKKALLRVLYKAKDSYRGDKVAQRPQRIRPLAVGHSR